MSDASFQLSNLTSNYCVPECMAYWQGSRDFDKKTVGEAMETMRKAIIADGILPLKWFDKENKENKENMVRGLLYWLISTSIDLSKLPNKEWTLKLV